MMRSARQELGISSAQTTMIGDTMETDILGGVEMGYRSVLVLSGGTALSDLANFAYQPDLVVDSIADLNNEEFFQYERTRFLKPERLLA